MAATDSMLPSTGATEQDRSRALDRSVIVAVVCIVVALASMLAMAIWGVSHDLKEIRLTLLQSEMNRLRSHSTRTISMIQDHLGRHEARPGAELETIQTSHWLRRYWASRSRDPSRLYAAIVTSKGEILMHSRSDAEGRHLGPNWYDHLMPEAGDDVVETHDAGLTGGHVALDVSQPIFFDDQPIGTYHSGFNYEWFREVVQQKQHQAVVRWAVIFGLIAVLVVAAGGSLCVVARHMTLFRQSMRLAHVRRLAELGQLMGAIAHEIRNPLNAMRLNLHVLNRVPALSTTDGEIGAESDALAAAECSPRKIIEETNREIQRIDDLIKVLLGYARPERSQAEEIDVCTELCATLGLLRPGLERSQVTLNVQLPDERVPLFIDRNRLRQVVLNLLNNAKEAVGADALIEVSATQTAEEVVIIVADNGPGVPEAKRKQIFEPFYTTKELGTGLGLPLVKRFVEEVGGTVTCEARSQGGVRFRLNFPASHRSGIVHDTRPALAITEFAPSAQRPWIT